MEQSNAPKTTGNSLIRHADDMIYLAVALVVVAVLLLFYELLVAKLGIPPCYHWSILYPALLYDTVV